MRRAYFIILNTLNYKSRVICRISSRLSLCARKCVRSYILLAGPLALTSVRKSCVQTPKM